MTNTRPLLHSALFILLGLTTAVGCTSGDEPIDSAEGAQTGGSTAAPAVGRYEADDDARHGVLDVTKADATTLAFSLEVVNKFGSNNQGIASGTARGANGKYTYRAEDCELTFDASRGAIAVAQEGSCEMGHNVYATGVYEETMPAAGSLCDAAKQERVVFSCAAREGKKVISVCASERGIQYRFGSLERLELTLPSEMAEISDKPDIAEGGYISLAGPGAGGAFATFHNGQYDYTVFTMNMSLGLDDEGRSQGLDVRSGVVVARAGARIGFVECAGEPASALPSQDIAEATEPFDIDLVP